MPPRWRDPFSDRPHPRRHGSSTLLAFFSPPPSDTARVQRHRVTGSFILGALGWFGAVFPGLALSKWTVGGTGLILRASSLCLARVSPPSSARPSGRRWCRPATTPARLCHLPVCDGRGLRAHRRRQIFRRRTAPGSVTAGVTVHNESDTRTESISNCHDRRRCRAACHARPGGCAIRPAQFSTSPVSRCALYCGPGPFWLSFELHGALPAVKTRSATKVPTSTICTRVTRDIVILWPHSSKARSLLPLVARFRHPCPDSLTGTLCAEESEPDEIWVGILQHGLRRC